jgi:hypothetical protein
MKINKEKIKTSFWSAIIGAIMVMIVGFGWGGWVLGSTSQRTADTMVEDALVARLSPMCLEQFNKDAQKEREREKYVEEQGWATMPFEKEPDRMVSELCVEQILNGG